MNFMYPLDYTGELPSNRVIGEIHELSDTNFKLVVPHSGYFYTHNLKVFDVYNNPLELGTHYECVYTDESVMMRTPGLEVCGAIILKPNVTGSRVTLNCNYVGGPYANYTRAIEQALTALDLNNREIDFTSIKGVPEYFKAAPHAEDVGNVFGFEYLITSINRLRTTIAQSQFKAAEVLAQQLAELSENFTSVLQQHTTDAVAHNTTAADVGAYSKAETDNVLGQLQTQLAKAKTDISDVVASQSIGNVDISSINNKIITINLRITVIEDLCKAAIAQNDGASLADLNTMMSAYAKNSALIAEIDARNNAVNNEATTRANADKALSNAISSEANTRANADNSLTNALNAEITNRANGDSGLSASITNLTNYLNTNFVSWGSVTPAGASWGTVVNKVARINGSVLEIADITDWHTSGSGNDYDIREVCQWNGQYNTYEIYNTGYYNAVDVVIRSDLRDKTQVSKIEARRARHVLRHIGLGIRYKLMTETEFTAGNAAQIVDEVFSEAITRFSNEKGEERLGIRSGAMVGLLVSGWADLDARLQKLERPWYKKLFCWIVGA